MTGAGTGIGRSVSLALLREGYAVLLAGRRRQPLEATVREAPEGAEALAVPTDVADPVSVGALFRLAREKLGRLDLLFNNAGLAAPPAPLIPAAPAMAPPAPPLPDCADPPAPPLPADAPPAPAAGVPPAPAIVPPEPPVGAPAVPLVPEAPDTPAAVPPTAP